VSDPVVPGAPEHVFQAGVQGFEIEMAVRVNEQRHGTKIYDLIVFDAKAQRKAREQ
jgi:hypothetical protein